MLLLQGTVKPIAMLSLRCTVKAIAICKRALLYAS